MTAIQTVLVGLGGIGTEIVDKVYSMIPDNERENVAVHGFDTDVNDIEKRKHLRGRITQISAPITVGQCYELVKKQGGTVADWFPPLTPELERKALTEGAAQIRAVSRLAYYYTMLGGLGNLERQISDIFLNKPEGLRTTPRIVIVSSLAGGTGAGLFLQTAFYLQDLLKKASATVITRGMFLLPDILIKNEKLKESEHDTVRANAYACLKELDAITRNAGGNTDGVTIELEYRPDQISVAGHQVHAIQRGQKPYDFCFLYDYENADGRNLGELNHYKEQVIQALFLQFFTPMGADNRSQEDNNLRQNIIHKGTNCYCGTGVARLVYPYESLIEYFGLRWISDSLAEEWRWLDDQYEQELQVFEQDQDKGVFRERPKKGKRYVELLDSRGSGDSPQPFFRRMYNSTRRADGNGRDLGPKIPDFINKIEARAKEVLKQKSDFQEALGQCSLNEGKLKIREQVAGEVAGMEDSLDRLKETVLRVVQELKTQVVNEVIASDCNADDCLGGDEAYRLNRWILQEPEPAHPVAARYMLYQVEMELEKRHKTLAAKNKSREAAIRRYRENMYDLPDTEDYQETAEDRVRMALEEGKFKRIFKNSLSEFVKIYQDGAEGQKRKLSDFASDKLLEEVYQRLIEAFRSLIMHWERYFDNLKSEKSFLFEEIDKKEGEHEGRTDPSIMFLLADRSQKKRTWGDMRTQLITGSELPADICRQLYVGVFQQFCHDFFPWSGERKSEPAGIRSILLDWTQKILRERRDLRMNVMMALQKSGKDMAEVVQGLHKLALPFISVPADRKENEGLAYWGIHTESAETLTEEQKREIFGGSDALRENDAFSPYELVRYRVVHGLKANDLPKFKGSVDASVAGSYFVSYRKGVRALEMYPETAVPHHLDRRWHRPAYMPDLNPDLARLDEAKGKRAFLLGLAIGMLKNGHADGRKVWELHTRDGVKTVQVNGRNIDSGFFDLYQSMPHNPIMVDKVIDGAGEQFEKDKTAHGEKIEYHQLIKGCGNDFPLRSKDVANVLDTILIMVNERPGENLLNLSIDLLECLLSELTRYCVQVYGEHKKNTAHSLAVTLLERVRDESVIYEEAKSDGSEYLSHWQNKIDSFLSELRQVN